MVACYLSTRRTPLGIREAAGRIESKTENLYRKLVHGVMTQQSAEEQLHALMAGIQVQMDKAAWLVLAREVVYQPRSQTNFADSLLEINDRMNAIIEQEK